TSDRFGTFDAGPLRRQVAHDVAHRVVGDHYVEIHDGLEQHDAGFASRLLEGEAPGELERDVGGVDGVELAVVELRLDVDDGVAGDDSFVERLANAFLDRRDEVVRDRAADDRVLEL